MCKKTITLILVLSLTIAFAATRCDVAVAQAIDTTFDQVPDGWTVERQIVVPRGQLAAFSRKLGGSITYANNTYLRDGDRRVQINVLQCATRQDAMSVQQALAKLKGRARDVCRDGNRVFEFVHGSADSTRFATEARYRLPIQPREATYRVRFDAVPLAGFEPMDWNKMYNLFLQLPASSKPGELESAIQALSERSFQIGHALELRNHGLGDTATQWTFDPKTTRSEPGESFGTKRYQFQDLPRRAGLPIVHVEATISSETMAVSPVDPSVVRNRLLAANEHWPADDPSIRALVIELTRDANSDRERIDALLGWFADEQHIRFGGPDLGSRYGTKKVIEQRFGHCWDYTDVFVTFCRAAGIPARQVIGWLHDGPGHVWAEVIVDDAWHCFDPTSGLACGSDYIPLVASDDGRLSYVYASSVEIEWLEAK